KEFSKQWYFVVDPSADPDLAYWASRLKKSPEDIIALYSIGQAYEKKYMLLDAALAYEQVTNLDPGHRKARAGYYNIFKRLERKSQNYEGLIIEVARRPFPGTNLPLILVRVNIYNGGTKPMEIDARRAKISAGGETSKSLSSLSQYASKAFRARLITADQYARLSYQLERNSPPLLRNMILRPGMSIRGMMAFPLIIPTAREFTVIIPVNAQEENLQEGRTEYLKFPFQIK
ncbi:MAG: hypothetical protein J7M18_03470, partial [Candidatus Eremiobacteraeota bacterium]|nr:hypothetical protein [Candidatus Eremiobacteraeota bacterium]